MVHRILTGTTTEADVFLFRLWMFIWFIIGAGVGALIAGG